MINLKIVLEMTKVQPLKKSTVLPLKRLRRLTTSSIETLMAITTLVLRKVLHSVVTRIWLSGLVKTSWLVLILTRHDSQFLD